MSDDRDYDLVMDDKEDRSERCDNCGLPNVVGGCKCPRCLDCDELLDEEEIDCSGEQCFSCFCSERDKD